MFAITAIPAFRDNYIWGLSHAGRAVLVDPGEAAPALAWLAARGLRLEAMLITHHHQDHQGGVMELLAQHPQAQVLGPGSESITGLTQPLAGGESLLLLETPVSVQAVPGHTHGHLAYRAGWALFCGDTLFGAGCGRLFEGTPVQMFAAMEWIATLPDVTQIFCAHEYTLLNLPFALGLEPHNVALQQRLARSQALRAAGQPTVPSSLAEERATNPFLRCHVPNLQAAVQAREPAAQTPEQVFAVLRRWRDAC